MRADIFCRRIDNYGDVGVCWRLARALRQAGGWRVRLWIDDLATFARMEPRCDPALELQDVGGIDIVAWSDHPPALPPGEVVIEAFACDPPETFRAAMRQRPPVWINLEYLSAEPWVESHHRLPSPQPDGLMKYFFFPGFTPATGGLLREAGLAARRDAFQRSREAQLAFLRDIGVGPASIAKLGEARLISLFCYPEAPLEGLVHGLRADPGPTLLLVPQGVAPRLETAAGDVPSRLEICRIPFLPQDDYDRLLWCADLNFVRGEDSVVRAGWAGRPLVWQIYPQTDEAHLNKLRAWLDLYRPPPQARALFEAWNATAAAPIANGAMAAGPATDTMASAWRDATTQTAWAAWRETAKAWDARMSQVPELAASLIAFCAEHRGAKQA
uniref:elongation factor P maturation arginine rhamnosyltransferase EarP n=1 Tax=Bordetella sputigena TaxID=1416810 RepID=UPI0039EF9049